MKGNHRISHEFVEFIPDEMSEKKHPRVHAWWRKLQARPAFKEARIEAFTSTL